ncbi:MAG: proprotein convertase P-domain-containing protein, partial [Candidatus Omnitrophota bacterium]|nr:proprotein convertase P-domain-containing protein [Candidatus Omnitrophota bacterium]
MNLNHKVWLSFIIIFTIVTCGINVYADSVFDQQWPALDIPDDDTWVYTEMYMSGAPANAVITRVDVCFEVTHDYPDDLIIDLQHPNESNECGLWENDATGTSYCKTDINEFNDLNVNGWWALWAKDNVPEDSGRLQHWSLTIFYKVPDTIPPYCSVNTMGDNPGQDTAFDDDGTVHVTLSNGDNVGVAYAW